MNLEPGSYLVICAIPDENGVPHYAMGMLAEIEVTEPAATLEAPVPDATVALVEMEFPGLPAEVSAGQHLWEIPDNGEQVHEIVIGQIAEGLTFDDIQAILRAGPPASPEATPVDVAEATPVASPVTGPPPVESVAGTAPMSPGQTNYLVLDLTPGEHFALGMLMPFTVT